ncbi:MAG: heparan N-sulfatase, partial [Bacteroidota bacterium]|nr:heparan N-sulfatase [Bacteroidota bacterium]
ILNRRPEFANQGPLDAVESPSFKALREAESKGTLTVIQKDILLTPRPAEELFAVQKDKEQANNLAGSKKYTSILIGLKQVLAKWQKETGDTEPSDLTPDWYDRVNGKKTAKHNKRGEMPGRAKSADKINAKGPF